MMESEALRMTVSHFLFVDDNDFATRPQQQP